ncbi:hypothetical protein ES707_11622 [subsurface metagenome]
MYFVIGMQTSIEIIEEIKHDASGIQRKLLTLPATGETISDHQQKLIDDARKVLLGWRSWELEELAKAFSEES